MSNVFNLGDVVTNGHLTGTVFAKYFATDKDEHQCILVESSNLCVRYTEAQIRELFPKKEEQSIAEYEREIYSSMNRYGSAYVHGFNITSPDYKDLKVVGQQNLIEGKYNIGDRVVTNKTGPINIGTVCGKIIGYKNNNALYRCKWDTLYPDWCSKPVYFIQLGGPNKSVTWEEWLEGTISNLKYKIDSFPIKLHISEEAMPSIIEAAKADYDASAPVFNICAPEDDLSLVGDISELFEEKLCKS